MTRVLWVVRPPAAMPLPERDRGAKVPAGDQTLIYRMYCHDRWIVVYMEGV